MALVTGSSSAPQRHLTSAGFDQSFLPAMQQAARTLTETAAETGREAVARFSEIEGVEHVYSASTPGMASLTVRFEVGEGIEKADGGDFASEVAKMIKPH